MKKTLMKHAVTFLSFLLLSLVCGCRTAEQPTVVYFTRDISPTGILKIYNAVNQGRIQGKTVIKWHSGEPHGPNILPIDMVKAVQENIPGSVLADTNTLYHGGRDTTEKHRETIKTNGWTFCPVDILDEEGAAMLPIRNGNHFKEMSVGSHLLNYDSMVVLTHFKGHATGGFGGSIKNIAIGNVDAKVGKRLVHGATEDNAFKGQKAWFMEAMVESASASLDYFNGHIIFINVLRNMSVDCDCAGIRAAKVKARDIGILASADIVAVDQASIDKVYALPEDELHDLRERIESREGLHQLEYGEQQGIGTRKYVLVDLDE